MGTMNYSPSKDGKSRLRGVFDDGQWKCDCDIRLPAKKLQTQRGKNMGRWFYSCQKSDRNTGGGCGFFLWEEDAQNRMQSAGYGTGRTVPATPVTPRTKPKTDSMRTPAITNFFKNPPPPKAPLSPSPSPGQKRSFPSEDDVFDSDPDLDDIDPQDLINEAAKYESPTKSSKPNPAATPSRRRFNGFQDDDSEDDDNLVYPSLNNDVFVTPNTKFREQNPNAFSSGAIANTGFARSGNGSLPTPSQTHTTHTNHTGPPHQPGPFLAPSAFPDSPLRNKSTNSNPLSSPPKLNSPPPLPAELPDTPSKQEQMRSPPSSFGNFSSSQDEEPPATPLSKEILGCLRTLNIDLEDERAVWGVQAISSRWTKKLLAAEKARDVSREGIKKRNERIAELKGELERVRGGRA